jgi:ribonuclease HII
MVELHEHWPVYDFATHKGYCTPDHQAALRAHGPCPEHRHSYVNVRAAADGDDREEWESDQ